MILPDRYRLTGDSTDGGMGDIHHCIDLHLNRRVVLKMLKDGEDSRRLLDEQKALLKVRSKHVVQLYDIVDVRQKTANKAALVLEHIDGTDLEVASMAADANYLKTIWQIACGLADIHQAGIIHRDIKPNNMRLNNDGVIKILDFGLSRKTGVEAQTRSIIGTPGYMAPELWGNFNISFDRSIDVYAFAITALVLLSARIPDELLQQPPRPLRPNTLATFFTGLPSDVVEIIERCISYNPLSRPTMKEVEAVIRAHLLYNRHRALFVLNGQPHEINAAKRELNLKAGDVGSIAITYNGLRFSVAEITGSVFINNMTFRVGDELPGCCVIAFGARESARSFVTFDASNPEVMP